jgi:hypothetical protein
MRRHRRAPKTKRRCIGSFRTCPAGRSADRVNSRRPRPSFALDRALAQIELAEDMAHPALAPSIGRDFDPFLYASIGQDRHGQALSVISALARSDLDPWREAIALSRMSLPAATQRLSRMIAALPGEPAPARPLEAIAGDLIALLPAGRGLVPPLPEAMAAAVGRPNGRLRFGLAATAVLAAIGLLVSLQSSQGPDRRPRTEPQAQHAPSETANPDSRPANTAGSGPT